MPAAAHASSASCTDGDPVGDVMQSRPPAAQELADRGIGAERLEQLDVAVADVEQRRVDALLRHRLAVDERHAELVAVERERVVDALDGDADVVDRGQHGAAEHIDRPRLGTTAPVRGGGAVGCVSVDAAARPRWMPARRSGAVTGVPAMIRSISSRSSTSSVSSAWASSSSWARWVRRSSRAARKASSASSRTSSSRTRRVDSESCSGLIRSEVKPVPIA